MKYILFFIFRTMSICRSLFLTLVIIIDYYNNYNRLLLIMNLLNSVSNFNIPSISSNEAIKLKPILKDSQVSPLATGTNPNSLA